MRTYRLAGVIAIAGLLSLAVSEPAKAITASLAVNDIVTVPGTSIGPQTPDFIVGSAIVDAVTTPPFNVGGQYRSPWELTAFPNLPYTSVRDGTAGYNIAGTSLSLFWGSPDPYNTLTFWTGLGGTGDHFDVLGTALGDPQALGHHLVLFLTDQIFQSVTISSTSPAFEFANMVTPIPAALPLFATGLGMMGWLARRRKRRHGPSIAA